MADEEASPTDAYDPPAVRDDDDAPERDPIPAPDDAPQLGAAFRQLQQPGVRLVDAVNVPRDRLPSSAAVAAPADPLAEMIRQSPQAELEADVRDPQMRRLAVQSTGDSEIDAMLMLKAVFDSVPSTSHRRLLGFLADRYSFTP
jgi:hypothetical protein